MEGLDDVIELQAEMEELATKILVASEDVGTNGLEDMYDRLDGKQKMLMLTVCEEVLKELYGNDELVGFLRENGLIIKKSAGELIADLQAFTQHKLTELYGSTHENLVEGLVRMQQDATSPKVKLDVETKEVAGSSKTHPAKERKVLPKQKDYVDYPDPYRWQRG